MIMEKEIIKRDIDCKKDYRNVFWYRGKDTKSMLKKLLERYSMPYSLDEKKMDKNILLFIRNLFCKRKYSMTVE